MLLHTSSSAGDGAGAGAGGAGLRTRMPQSAQTVTAEAFLGGLAVLDPDRFVLQKRVVCSKRGTAPAPQYVAFGGGVEAGNIK